MPSKKYKKEDQFQIKFYVGRLYDVNINKTLWMLTKSYPQNDVSSYDDTLF